MRKICLALIGLFLCINGVEAAERGQNTVSRQSSQSNRNENISSSRTTQKRTVSARDTINLRKNQTGSRNALNKTVVGRATTLQKNNPVRTSTKSTRVARAATSTSTKKAFDSNYNSCRDTYFTCMDQFCGTLDANYLRCVCSSKLQNIKSQEKKLEHTADSLNDFEDFNIDAISKTATEVKSMSTATSGENAKKKDKSVNNNTLQNIKEVLTKTKQKSLSTAGKLDIAGDIKSIWSTTELIGGADIANLSGEALFNAVHTQCYDLSKEYCSASDLKMVSSAYGMYIENDCSIIQNRIDQQMNAANTDIRSTRHKMQDARLENYNAHNSLNINDCVARVRKSLTNDVACGENYVHCLDFTHKYLDYTTGEAIYSPEFYQIENQISLSGDVLKNGKNAVFVNALNAKRSFAAQDLDLCRDNADEVWNEFLRQALVEIYQAQQERVATVKEECLQVVNKCYLKQSEDLKNFNDEDSPMVFVKALELSEEMCADKLNTCSNLYGGGPEGLEILIATMTGITNLTIEQSCPDLLKTFAQSLCAVQESDSLHYYPYGCRIYAPGESYYAREPLCNTTLINPFSRSDILATQTITQTYTDYLGVCKDYRKKYTSCKVGYYLHNEDGTATSCGNESDAFDIRTKFCRHSAYECLACPAYKFCSGGQSAPVDINDELYRKCGQYYVDSLYQKLVIYALQNCTRNSDTSGVLSESLLAEIDKISKSIRSELIDILAEDCSDLYGKWVDSLWVDDNNDGYHDISGDVLLNDFYVATGANKLWGYCKDPTY
jgi:hypothetical protein